MMNEQRSVTTELPEMLLPTQFFSDRLLVGRASGELALRWAVFSDGLSRYWKLASDYSFHDSEEFLEEESWLLADETEWPFSFASLCETFGLHVSSVRSSLLAWKRAHLPESARLVPHA
jgi:hypothetical protein